MSTAPPPDASGLSLFTVPTPNGLKITLALEELKEAGSKVTWTEHRINMGANEQKEPWFLAINPNGRIPAIIDNDRHGFKVWETNSILLYLAKYYDPDYALHFKDENDETDMITWQFFQHGGLGPMQGQAGFFVGNSNRVPFAAKRYINETKRLLGVYEGHLKDRDYLVGDGKGKYSFADITTVTWARGYPFSLGLPSIKDEFPNVQAWIDRIEARPAAKRAFSNDMISKFKSEPGWEKKAEERVAWVWEDEKKPAGKDEL